MIPCSACRRMADRIVRCDCAAVYCPKCFKEHHCGGEMLAQWSRQELPEDGLRRMDPATLLSALSVRPYQRECVDAIREHLAEHLSTLAVLPTGTGKTVVMGIVARDWEKGRVLVVAHRDELIRQAADKIGKIIGENCDIEMAEDRADLTSYKSHVVVTSVQTMRSKKRHSRFKPEEFGLVMIDEAHHAPAPTYGQVIDYFGQNPGLCILGVTATPDRADEAALGQVFKSVAYNYEITSAIADGWLVPIEQQFVFVDGLDFSNARTTAGDLNGGDLAKLMEAEEILHKVVDPTISLAGEQQTLVFAASVAHAQRMAEIFNRHRSGSAECIWGEMDKQDRRSILGRYSRREFQYLVNCGIATEGFDEPQIGVVAVARPTKSRALYAQMVGRGTRPLAGVVDGPTEPEQRQAAIAASEKPSLLVLDFVGNSGRHKLISVADILGGVYDDDVVESARERAAAKSKRGEKADMTEELREALKAKEEREKARRKSLVAKASFGTKSVDPFNILDIAPTREPGWHKGRKPTEKMVATLRKFKVDEKTIEGLSFHQAGQMLDSLIQRIKDGKCTYKQAQWLTKNGMDPNLSRTQASEVMDAFAKNRWKRPEGFVPPMAAAPADVAADANRMLQEV